ncbi:hypothetical protein [Rhizobium sp. Root1204]|uniref:hypothetical protein n=1 Tax=Rhizobium sp. Root1204 TaxID=1736428 RepID=UPI000714F7F2|nr:hypothetical protein [Rhizobium sp. Root1204]KQV41321.1 hypothetical protein ASC96_18690 [Rhizobium sp. Root1204]
MNDYLFFLTAKDGDREAFHRYLLNDFGPRVTKSPACSGLCINVAVEPLGGSAIYENEKREGSEFDATVDLTCPDDQAFRSLFEGFRTELDARTMTNYVYPVTKIQELDNGEVSGVNPSCGYKIMRGFFFHDDLPPSARKRSWDSHVNAAKRIHGFSRYVRYWIGDPLTEGSPRIGGATNLHFADDTNWKERYFQMPDGQVQIAQDITHFIERGLARVFTREHILK